MHRYKLHAKLNCAVKIIIMCVAEHDIREREKFIYVMRCKSCLLFLNNTIL